MQPTYFRFFLVTLALFWCVTPARAQEVSIALGGEINTCSGTFVDANGTSGPHSPNGQTRQLTICSNGQDGTHIQLSFSEIALSGDLIIYNGRTTDPADSLTILSAIDNGKTAVISATAANPTGCLTVTFRSFGQNDGWQAAIDCKTACQPVQVELVSATPAAQPDRNGYIDVCPGDPITLTGRGIYPEDGVIYDQDDNTSTFLWNFQDGTQLEGQTVTYAYTEPGGYVVQLSVTDFQGCTSTNRISQRVRVSPPPRFNPDPGGLEPLCPGEDVTLTIGGGSAGFNFAPAAQQFSFNTGQTRAEIVALPDGTGRSYTSPISFDNFDPGQLVSAADDIVRICATIEHSYIGDLDMYVECPNGRRIDFILYDDNDGTLGQTFGYGLEDDTGPEPPETYCWTATAAQTILDVARGIDPSNGDDPVMPFDRNYRPLGGGFSDLIGCPLNGEWTLNIVDNLIDDDGTIYNWTIEFASDLYPAQEDFSVGVTDVSWVDTDIFSSYAPQSVVFTGGDPGYANARLTTNDEFGCVYDTLVRLDVKSPFHPECFQCNNIVARSTLDTLVCDGATFTPDLLDPNFRTDQLVTWRATTDTRLRAEDYSTNLAYLSTLTVTDHLPATVGNVATDLVEVCVDFRSAASPDELVADLVAPNGNTIRLIDNFSGAPNTLQACFSPTATQPLTVGGTGPFAAASGDWAAAFQGSPINGDWQLRLTNGDNTVESRLFAWSIALLRQSGATYSWTPAGPDLSCTDCPNPTITATTSGSYTLRVTTADGCAESATVNVDIGSLDLTVTERLTPPSCAGLADGSIELDVVSSDPALSYRWSNGATTEDIASLMPGDYTLSVTGNQGCTETFTYTLTAPVAIEIAVTGVKEVTCFGGATGEIETMTTGGSPPYTYLWDDPNAQDDADAGALQAGSYTVVVTDSRGCTASASATITEPEALTLAFQTTPPACRDGSDGSAVATVDGGSPPFRFAWQTGATTAEIDSLGAGNYVVTVTDDRGCQLVDSVLVQQPALGITATVSTGRPGCAGQNDNQATVTASGGSGNFTYRWTSGETTATATALGAGTNSVTVTDTGGCALTVDVELDELDTVRVNLLASAPSCNGSTDGQIAIDATGGLGTTAADYTYRWSTGQTDLARTGLAGGVTYTVTATDAQGCFGVGQRLLANPPPIAFETLTTPVACFGDRDGAINVVNITGPNEGDYELRWSTGAGLVTGPTITNQPAGRYPLVIQDFANCSLDTTLVIPSPEPLGVDVNQTDVGCFGDTNGAVSVRATGGAGAYLYNWSTGSTSPELSDLAGGDYILTLTDGNACVDSFTVTIQEPVPIGITANFAPALCFGEATGSVSIAASGGRPPYTYSLDNRAYSRSPTFIGLPAGDYFAYARDSAGCVINTTVSVEDGPGFGVELGEDLNLVFGDSVRLDANLFGGVGAVTYRWRGSYDGTLSCTDCPDPIARPEYEIDYFLSVTDENGCEDEDRLRISVRKIREVAVPTGFSPNGDGRNDRLLVHGRPGTRVVAFTVFDRWGGMIAEDTDFAVNDPERGWDGSGRDGKIYNAGVYLYKLVVAYEDGSQETLSGQTTLIR